MGLEACPNMPDNHAAKDAKAIKDCIRATNTWPSPFAATFLPISLQSTVHSPQPLLPAISLISKTGCRCV